jgi:hypothetical protein
MRIGTFACRSSHRDTKASKRANLPARDNCIMTEQLKIELYQSNMVDKFCSTDNYCNQWTTMF